MLNDLPPQIVIAAQILRDSAKGDTITDRFKSVITRERIDEACFMCSTEDEQFRSAVGGLILSYPDDAPERDAIQYEMRQINRLSTALQAATLGMGVSLADVLDGEQKHPPIGLLPMWRERTK
jgi:hypothetical protein